MSPVPQAVPGIELTAELGRGAGSVVYRGRRDGRDYAVKLLRSHDRPVDPIAFRREAALLATLDHPALSRIHEVGQAGDVPYLVMDLIEGRPLAAELAGGPLAEGTALDVAAQIAGALGVAHRAGLVHRDVKPENIMIRPDGRAYLIDFGLAAWAGGDVADTAVGTFRYSAPEQTGMLRRVVDGRADLYSLGVVLFECLTGSAPFIAEDVGELLHLHLAAAAPDVRSIRPEVSPAAAAAVAKLLAKDPDDRYRTAERLLADLQRICTGPHAPVGPDGADEGPLIGRTAAWTALLSRWQQAVDGAGGIVLLEGPAGIGKSRVARVLTARVQKEGGLVLLGVCGAGRQAPLEPLRSALHAHLTAIDEFDEADRAAAQARVRAAIGDAGSTLNPLSPLLAQLTGAGPAAQHDKQDLFAAAVARFLVALADGESGGVLHLDNAESLDEATRLVLRRLSDVLADSRLLVVVTARDGTAFHDDFVGHAVQRVPVGPLAAPDLVRLIGQQLGPAALPPELIARLTTHSAGNPLAALEYVRAVVDGGLVRPSWGTWLLDEAGLEALALPDDMMELLLRRVDSLGEDARRLLTVAAVIGSPFAPDQVAEVARADAADAATVFAAAVEYQLIDTVDGGYGFVHDRVCEALLGDLSTDEQRRLHQRTAEAMAARGAAVPEDVYALAIHLLQGDCTRTPVEAHRAAAAAGALALDQNAAADALAFLRQADQVRLDARIVPDAAFHRNFAVAALRTGHVELAREQAIAALRTEADPVRRAGLHNLLATAHQIHWEGNEAIEQMRLGLAALGMAMPANPVLLALSTIVSFVWGLLLGSLRASRWRLGEQRRERYRLGVQLLANGGHSAAIAGRHPMIAATTLRGLRLAAWLGPGPEYAAAYCGLAALTMVAQMPSLAVPLLAKATAAVAGSGDLAVVARVEWMRALVEEAMVPMGRASGGQSRFVLESQGRWLDASQFLTGVNWLGYFQVARGYQRDAEQWYRRALARTPGRQESFGNLIQLLGAQCAALAGHPDAAEALLDEFRAELGNRVEVRGPRLSLAVAALQVAIERGDTGDEFDRAVADFDEFRAKPYEVWQAERMAWVHRATGRLEQARIRPPEARDAALARARRAVRRLRIAANGPTLRGFHRVARADLLHLRGRHRRALRDLAAAELRAGGLDVPLLDYEIARLRARVYLALANRPAAERYARFALSIAGTSGWRSREHWIRTEFGIAADVSVSRPADGTVSGRGEAREHLQRRRWQALQQVSLAAVTVLDPGELARVVLDEIVRIFGAERAFLFLSEEEEGLRPYLGRDAAGNDLAEPAGYGSSLVHRVYATRDAVVVTGSDEGEALGSLSTVVHGLRSIMVVPIALQGRLLGVVYLDSRVAKGIFTSDDVDILTAIANHMAMSLETTRAAQLELAVSAARKQRDLAETLRQAMAALSGTLDPTQVTELLLTTLADMLPLDAAILLHRRSEGTLGWAAGNGVNEEDVTAEALAADPSLAGLLDSDKPTAGCPPERPVPLPGLLGANSAGWLAVPMHVRGEPRGLLIAVSRQRAYTEAELEIAAAVAGQGLTAWDNAVLFRQVEHLATRDGLTGLYNRREFTGQANYHLQQHRPAAAVMVDIDFFKKINDTYGHGIGDQVIQEVAHRLEEHSRAGDIVCRYGGEEFAILLPDTTHGQAAIAAERLHAAVTTTPVDTDVGALPVTVSLGLAPSAVHEELSGLLGRADKALYEAKRSGRNRVAVAR